MKRLLLLLVLLCPSVASAQTLYPNVWFTADSQPILNFGGEIWDAVVRVRCSDGSCGSGVLVKEGDHFTILTAAHVVRDAGYNGTAKIIFRNGKSFPSRGIYTNRDGSDSAAILIDDPGVPAVCIAEESPKHGEALLACGYGGNDRLIGQLNTFAGQRGQDIEMIGKIRSGDSGGPVFNSKGQVVGLNSASAGPGQQGMSNYCCSWHPFRDFLNRVRSRIAGRSSDRAERMEERIAQSQGSCPGGMCPPQYQPRPRPQPPGDVQPPTRPAEPKPTPQPPQPAAIDYDKLAVLIAAKMPKPKDGVDGKDGTNGKDGKDGKDADPAKLAALEAELAALKNAGFYVQVFDHNGQVYTPKTFIRLGQTLDIKPIPVIVK